MSQAEMVALLWRREGGYGKSLAEIADLTDGQIVALTRDYEADPAGSGGSGGGSRTLYPKLTKEHFVATYRAAGKGDAEIEALWEKDYGDRTE